MMRRKLRRSLLRRPGPPAALAVVFALAIGAFVGIRGAYGGIGESVLRAYAELALPDLVADVAFAPTSTADLVAAVDGVAAVVPRITVDTTLVGRPGVRVRAVSVPREPPALGRVQVVRGRALSGGPGEALIAEAAAAPQGIEPGDVVELRDADGGIRALRIVGVARQPQHLAMIPPNGYMSTPRSFLVLFVSEVEARGLLGRSGGVTTFDIGITPLAAVDDVAGEVKRVLRRYRVTVTVGSKLASVRNIRSHLEALRAAALVFPLFFLLGGVVGAQTLLGRLVRDERGFIGLMRAQGVGATAMAGHYLAHAGVTVVAGVGLGLPIAFPLANAIRLIFAADLGVPATGATLDPGLALAAGVVAAGAALVGAGRSAWVAAQLRPAEALRPPVMASPGRALRRSRDSVGGVRARLILRGMTRNPARLAMTAVGFGLAVTMAVAPAFMLREMGRVERRVDAVRSYDMRAVPSGVQGEAWVAGLAAVDGVRAAEPVLELPVTVRIGAVDVDTYVLGVPDNVRLLGVPVPPPGTALLADGLPSAGSNVTVTGPLGSIRLEVGGRVDYPLARPVVVPLSDAQRLVSLPETVRTLLAGAVGTAVLGASPVTSALLQAVDGRVDEVARRVAALPGVARVDTVQVEKQDLRRIFALSRAFIGIIELFATLLGTALLYATVSVSAAERRREFVALRMLGMSTLGVGGLFAAEVTVMAVLGWLAGVPAGWWLARMALDGFPDFLPGGIPLDPLMALAVGGGALVVVLAVATPTVVALGRADLAAVAREGSL